MSLYVYKSVTVIGTQDKILFTFFRSPNNSDNKNTLKLQEILSYIGEISQF